MSKFLDLFEKEKPIIGMLHLSKDHFGGRVLDLAKYEIEIYLENGIDGILVEDYFGDLDDVEKALEYLYLLRSHIVYGVNYLRNYETAFSLAKSFDAKFIQVDSVSGHLIPGEDVAYGEEINDLRLQTGIPVIGGVRFKYKRHLSGRSLEEDLQLGMQRSDGIVVTGAGTGLETPITKAQEFRDIIGDFPLIVGAGLNLDNAIESMQICDAAIVGSYVKDNHQDNGIVSGDNVQRLIKKINAIRK